MTATALRDDGLRPPPEAKRPDPHGGRRSERGSRARRRRSLAGQLLALQLVIVSLVLVAVAAVSLAQSDARFEGEEGRRALSVAETVGATAVVRAGLDNPDRQRLLPTVAENARSVSGSSYVTVASADRTVLASPDPGQVGDRLDLHGSPVLAGRSWVGVVADDGVTSVVAHVPVLSDAGEVIGLVAVGRDSPTFLESLGTATPNLLTYLGIASALGVVGSLLLARRVKRQTLGLEPREIAGLVEHRDAMLHSIREGVVGLDPQRRVTLVNDEATQLLGLPPDAVGRTLEELDLDARLQDVLTGRTRGQDQVVLLGERVLTLNRMPIASRGRPFGSVTTLRDRTELVTLQRELDVTRHATDTLRAQAHEFANRLHTIAGLVELEEYGEVVRYVTRVSDAHARLSDEVTSRIADPSLAALLIAKGSLAAEQGVSLRVAERSRLDRVDEELAADLVTVVGNLVDNALDAVGPARGGWVEVAVEEEPGAVRVVVRDSGPGVAPEIAREVFRRGFTTKGATPGGARGFGLALTRHVCTRRGGEVAVHNEDGAVFTARLPTTSGAAPREAAPRGAAPRGVAS